MPLVEKTKLSIDQLDLIVKALLAFVSKVFLPSTNLSNRNPERQQRLTQTLHPHRVRTLEHHLVLNLPFDFLYIGQRMPSNPAVRPSRQEPRHCREFHLDSNPSIRIEDKMSAQPNKNNLEETDQPLPSCDLFPPPPIFDLLPIERRRVSPWIRCSRPTYRRERASANSSNEVSSASRSSPQAQPQPSHLQDQRPFWDQDRLDFTPGRPFPYSFASATTAEDLFTFTNPANPVTMGPPFQHEVFVRQAPHVGVLDTRRQRAMVLRPHTRAQRNTGINTNGSRAEEKVEVEDDFEDGAHNPGMEWFWQGKGVPDNGDEPA